jgi:hypothetical protein
MRLAFLRDIVDEDPLEWCDFGMLCALDLVEREIVNRKTENRHLEIEDVLEIIAAERENVTSQSLHEIICSVRRTQTARLDCLNEDPLEWLDFGISCTCDFLEREILDRQQQGQHPEINDVLEIIDAERKNVMSQSLHEFIRPGTD